MVDSWLLPLVALLAAALAFCLGWFAHRRAGRAERRAAERTRAAELELAEQRARFDAERGARVLREELAAAESRIHALEERLQDAAALREQSHERDRAEQRVLHQLAPVRETLGRLAETVTELEQQRAAQHGELQAQLRTAVVAEERLRGTADSLAAALRSNNTRGVWGETQLRRLVEAAGMVERVDFTVQDTLRGPDAVARPDMIVRLPGNKQLAIDAKVPMSAFLDASGAGQHTPEDEEKRRALLARHTRAVREHITALGGREYWNALPESPELVIAFIPSESLLASALEADPSLLEYAFEQRVALASPVSLWAILKSVAHTWRQDTLTDEAKTLFDLSRELHTRLGRTAGHLDKLGRSVARTVQDYNAFVGSMERQVLPTARKIGALNEERILAAPESLESAVRPLTAPELRHDEELPRAGAAERAPAGPARREPEGPEAPPLAGLPA